MTPTTTLPSQTVEEILNRAGRPDFDRWAEQVARCGHCSRPVRLRGRVEHRSVTGRHLAYSSDAEPDRVLLIRCGNRRAAACPSCSYEYAGDMWQLLYAGAAGGRKGVPESIRSHPLVFATLTAPGFGPVHTTRTDRTRGPARCRPAHGTPRLCSHGRPTWCTATHREDDPRLGQPICPDCYDYSVDALTLAVTILTVVVIDDDVFTRAFGAVTRYNEEGEIVAIGDDRATEGVPFTRESVRRMLGSEPMASPGAACLALAWYHRDRILGL